MSETAVRTVVCVKCGGTTRLAPDDGVRQYLPHIAGYRSNDDTVPCDNCGGQTMSNRGTGRTRVDPATGAGCLHSYRHQRGGNCYHIYTCTKCGDRYDIDSGD